MAGIVVDRLELQDFGIGGDEGAEVLPGGCSATTGRGGNLPRGKPRSATAVLRIVWSEQRARGLPAFLRLGQALVALCVPLARTAGTLPPCPNALAFSRLIVLRSVTAADGAVRFARARSGLPLRTTATRVRAAVATGQRQAAQRALRRAMAADDVSAPAGRV